MRAPLVGRKGLRVAVLGAMQRCVLCLTLICGACSVHDPERLKAVPQGVASQSGNGGIAGSMTGGRGGQSGGGSSSAGGSGGSGGSSVAGEGGDSGVDRSDG